MLSQRVWLERRLSRSLRDRMIVLQYFAMLMIPWDGIVDQREIS